MLKYYKLIVVHFLSSCNMCHSNKLESVFECEVSRLLYDEGEVEYWMYEPKRIRPKKLDPKQCNACNTCPQKKKRGVGSPGQKQELTM